jgi:hypothetical protein
VPDPPIVIPSATDRYKASEGVECEGGAVINCDFEDDAFNAAATRLDTNGIQKRQTDPVPPPFG